MLDNDYFRGDTFIFPFTLQNENEEAISFEVGDILRFGAKDNIYNESYALYKEIEVSEEMKEIQFKFLPSETQNLELKKYIIELELTRGEEDVGTIYQNEILVKGDVVRNGSNNNSNT